MPRVLLIAATTGYQTRSFGDAAERIGVDLVYATDRCNLLDDPWQDRAVPVRFHDEDSSLTAILDAARQKPFEGVIAVGDRTTTLAARVNEVMALRGHSVLGARAARSKVTTREKLRAAGLLTPWFVPARSSVEPRSLASSVTFPCVVKPVSLSGSRGVMRADNEEGLVAALYRLRSMLQSPDIRKERNPEHDNIVVEGFIPGREFAIEGLMNRGALHVLAIFDKPDPLDGPFFEETIYVTPASVPARTAVELSEVVARAADALGLSHGPVHAEVRVNDDGVHVLEVAARPIGGLCARALRFTQGGSSATISLEELLLRHAIGESSEAWSRESAASGVMMIPIPRRGVYRDVVGLDEARAVEGVVDLRITAKGDQVLLPLPEGSSYLGFIFARAETPDAVVQALREAHRRLEFTIDPEVPMLQSLHG